MGAAGPGDGSNASIAEIGGHGGQLASVLSAFALGFSGLSFYVSVMKTADLEVYVPPVIQYARDKDGYVELFAIPLTVVNSGARTGTVISMELEVENLKADAETKTKRYYSAYLGEHSPREDDINRAFAPVSLAGRATFSDTVRFYPIGDASQKVVDDAGDYKFTLTLKTAVPAEPDFIDGLWRKDPPPVTFEKSLPSFSVQLLEGRRATIPLYDKDWMPPPAPAGAPQQ
jgi:hypothetical protein